MKNGCFEVGDVVRIGGYIPEYDSNYHKIGTVISIGKDGYPHVRMIDEWSIPIQNGIVRHLPPDAWELAPNSFIGVSSLVCCNMMKFKIGDLVWLNIEGKFYHSRGYVKGISEQYGIVYPVVEMIDDIDLTDEIIHCVNFLPNEQWELVPGSFKVRSLL